MFFTVMHRISFAFIVCILVFQSVDARWHEELKQLNAEREVCLRNLEPGFVIKPLDEQSIDIITGRKCGISDKLRVTGPQRKTIYRTIMGTAIGKRESFFEQRYDFSKQGAESWYYAHLTACYIIHTATQILEGPQPITTVDALAKSLFAYFQRLLLYKASALQTFGVEKGVTTKILGVLERYSEARYKRLLTDKFIDWYKEVKKFYPETQPSYGINMDELPAAQGVKNLAGSYERNIAPLRRQEQLTILDCRRALAISDVYRVFGEESATEDVFHFEARFGVALFQAQSSIQDSLSSKVLINEMLEVFEHSLRSNHHQLNQVLESLGGSSDDKKPTHKRGQQLQPRQQVASSPATIVSNSVPSLFDGYTPKPGQSVGGKQKKAEGTGFYTQGDAEYYIKRSEKFPADDWAEILTAALGRDILGQDQKDLFAECIPIRTKDGQVFVRSTCAKGWKTLYEHKFGSNFFLDHFRSDESKKTHIIIASLSDAQKEQLAKILAVCLWLGEYDCGTQNIGIDEGGRVVKIDHGWGLADLCREESRVARLLESKPMWGTRGAHINTGVPTNHFKDFRLLIKDACFRKALREVIDFIKAKKDRLGQIVKIQLGEMSLGDSLDRPLKLFAKQIGLDGLDLGSFPLQFIADQLQQRLVERMKSMELVCALLECRDAIKRLKEEQVDAEKGVVDVFRKLKETITTNFVADRPENFMSEWGVSVIKEVKACLSNPKIVVDLGLRDFFARIEEKNAIQEHTRREQETADRQTAQLAIAALNLTEKADDDLLLSIQTALDDGDDKGRNAQAQQFYKETLKKIQQATKSQLRMRTLQRTFSKKELRRVGAAMDMSKLFQQGAGK